MLTLHFPNGELPDVFLDKGKTLLGSAPGSDLLLTAKGVEDQHAEIWIEGRSVVLVKRKSCLVNGEPVAERCRLIAGDQVTIGTVQIQVRKTDSPPAPTPSSQADEDEFGRTAKFHLANDGWFLRGLSESVAGKEFPLDGKVIIGRDPACDITLDSAEISRQHAELAPRGNRVTLRDLGSTNGTRVNGQLVTHAILKSGDKFSLDLTAFELLGGENDSNQTLIRATPKPIPRPPLKEAADTPRLVVRSGEHAGQVIPLNKPRMSIGRTPENDIVLEDGSVSRLHARLDKVSNGWHLTDCGSTNGTAVNGADISAMALHNGDRIRLGRIKMVLEDAAALPGEKFDSSKTISRAVKVISRGVAPWRWVIGGAVLLLLALAAWWLARGAQSEPQITSRLQVSDVWRRELGENFQHPLTPAIGDLNQDGYLDIVVCAADGFLVALDGEEGKKIFEGEVTGRLVAPPTIGDVNGDGVDDLVVGTYQGLVYALNGKGQILWKVSIDRDYGGVLNRPVIRDLNGDGKAEVLLATSGKGLVALDGERGWELWNSEAAGLGEAVTVPAFADLDGNDGLELAALDRKGEVTALSLDRDRLWKAWSQTLPSFHGASPAVASSGDARYLVVATEANGIYGLYGKSGLVAWHAKLDGVFQQSPLPITTAQGAMTILVVDTKGRVSALDGASGAVLWQFAVGGPVNSAPALFDVDGDAVQEAILMDQTGGLTILDLGNGQLRFREKIAEAKQNQAALVMADVNNDSLLEFISVMDDGLVRAIGLNRRVATGANVWPQFLGGS